MLSRCSSYIDKFISFSRNCFELPTNINRVVLKRAILDATIGLPIEPFIKELSKSEKQILMKFVSSECPVTCYSKNKMAISPIESSPSKIIQSSKKLRHYLMIPESQACRGCIKRTRCKKFLQVEQGIPDLSDVARVVLGMNTICNLYIEKCELITEEDGALSNIDSFFSVLHFLEEYLLAIKEKNGSLKVPRGNDKECSIEAGKQMKRHIISKLQDKISKMYNIPAWLSLAFKPNPNTKMTKMQRLLQDKLDRLMGCNKDKSDCEFIWVPEPNDKNNETEYDLDEKMTICSLNIGNETKIIQLDTLKDEHIEFRLSRDLSDVSSGEVKQYDINGDKIISSIKIKDCTFVNLNEAGNQNYPNYVNRYKGERLNNSNRLTNILEYVDQTTAKENLSDIVKVPFETPSQSSGNSKPPIVDKRNTVGSKNNCLDPLDIHEFGANDEYINYKNNFKEGFFDRFKLSVDQSGIDNVTINDNKSIKVCRLDLSVGSNYPIGFPVWKFKSGETVCKNLTFPNVKGRK